MAMKLTNLSNVQPGEIFGNTICIDKYYIKYRAVKINEFEAVILTEDWDNIDGEDCDEIKDGQIIDWRTYFDTEPVVFIEC